RWFGLTTTDASFVTTVDASQGILTPYYENNNRIIGCPSLVRSQILQVYEGLTGGYGYNIAMSGVHVNRVASTSTTYVFLDSALLVNDPSGFSCPGAAVWCAQESDTVAPPFPLQAVDPLYGLYQTMTHFRHVNMANIAFLDGHVEPRTQVPVAN